MIAVQRFMPEAVAALLRKAPLTPEKVAFAWRSAVGGAVDNATSIELRGTLLLVRAKNPEWRREVERSLGVVRSRMEAILGKGVIGEIQVIL